MRFRSLLFVLFFAPAFAPLCHAQSLDDAKEEALRMGFLLYRLEKAAWNGTDLVRAQAPEAMEKVGGYVTYPDGEFTHFTFYDRTEPPQVVASLSFDSTFSNDVAVVDYSPRALTDEELRLLRVRASGIEALHRDTSVVTYENTRFNLIPLLDGDRAKMYVLTGPQVSGVVVFGNDYLVSYDDQDLATGVRSLHRNIIPVNYEASDTTTSSTLHSHHESSGPILSATDICTLMLYGPYTGWKSHQIISEKYLSIWNLETNNLVVIPRKALQKIETDQKKRSKRRAKRERKRGGDD